MGCQQKAFSTKKTSQQNLCLRKFQLSETNSWINVLCTNETEVEMSVQKTN